MKRTALLLALLVTVMVGTFPAQAHHLVDDVLDSTPALTSELLVTSSMPVYDAETKAWSVDVTATSACVQSPVVWLKTCSAITVTTFWTGYASLWEWETSITTLPPGGGTFEVKFDAYKTDAYLFKATQEHCLSIGELRCDNIQARDPIGPPAGGHYHYFNGTDWTILGGPLP